MDVVELIKKVRRIEIKAKQKVQDLFSGAYHSAFKGRGMSFSETRSYQYGDDVRNIDWNVTARSENPQVKVFEEERELTIMLLVDVSASTYFGSKGLKSELIAELVAIIGFNAMKNNDKVGAILFSSNVVKFVPASKGRKAILHIIREIINLENENQVGTDINQALRYLINVQKKKAIVFLFSDFLDCDYKDAFALAANKHDIIPVRIFDDYESQLPDVGLVRLYDLEQKKEVLVDTSDKKSMTFLKQKALAEKAKFDQAVSHARMKSIEINRDTDYIRSFIHYFNNR
jgi:uncharacterized protein (DUF58 family)